MGRVLNTVRPPGRDSHPHIDAIPNDQWIEVGPADRIRDFGEYTQVSFLLTLVEGFSNASKSPKLNDTR